MKHKKWMAMALAGFLFLGGCGQSQKTEGSVSEKSAVSSGALTTEDLKKTVAYNEGTEVAAPDGTKYYKNTGTFYDTFDTIIQVTAYTGSEEEFKEIVEYAHTEFQRLHKLYDNYNSYDGEINIDTVNQKAGKEAVKVNADLFSCVQFAVDNYDRTLGKVNIAMGPVLRLWHDVRDRVGYVTEDGEKTNAEKATAADLPTQEQLEKANRHTDIHKVKLDEANQTIFLEEEGMSLDLGAVGKGYATQIVADKLKEKGLTSGIINAGGNVKTIGLPVDGRDHWTVAISNPRPVKEAVAATVEVGSDASIVTSGDYQRYFEVDGKRYHHIIDPATLQPGGAYPSVSIMTEDSGMADMLSTAFFLSTKEEVETIRRNFSSVPVEVVWIGKDGIAEATSGIHNLVQK